MSRDWLRPLQDQYGRHPFGNNAEQGIAVRERETGTWPRGTLAQFCDHLDYLAGKVGHDHVGIGSHFFGGPQGQGLEDASCFPRIFAELIRRKWSGRNLRKLASGNFVRVLRETERSAKSSMAP
jgi:membrane dipeptidase